MARVTISETGQVISDFDEAKKFLASINIGYERWDTAKPLEDQIPAEEILEGYAKEIEELKKSGGYVTADVIDVSPETPNLDVMLAKFSREHWHDEDEVRFIVKGQGVFHINTKSSPVVAIEVVQGDLLRVPKGTLHWFDLCDSRRIRAIRLFEDITGWTPHYSDSGVDKGYMPVCFGFNFIPPQFASL